MNMKELKLCKDCKFYKKSGIFGTERCLNYKNVVVDLVNGDTWDYMSPSNLRGCGWHNNRRICGEDGSWFEPKI